MSEPQLLGYKPGVAESDRSGSANGKLKLPEKDRHLCKGG